MRRLIYPSALVFCHLGALALFVWDLWPAHPVDVPGHLVTAGAGLAVGTLLGRAWAYWRIDSEEEARAGFPPALPPEPVPETPPRHQALRRISERRGGGT